MRRAMLGALWGMILYLVGHAIVSLIVGSPAVDAWRPVMRWWPPPWRPGEAGKGGCRARGNSRDPSETK